MSIKLPLAGQAALVTGAGRGIGAACAKALAGAGARVLVNYYRDPDEAQAVVEAIKTAGGEASVFAADVSKEAEVEAMFAAMQARYGGIDVLVNNAGVQADAAFVEMTAAQWARAIDVDLTGSFLCARAAARSFIERGPRPEVSCSTGRIIFISSVHVSIPWPGHANYTAAKGGVHMLMTTLASELGPHQVRVNAVAPGAIKTNINRGAWETPEAEARLLKLIPYGRVGVTDDVARAVLWLASDESDYVTGCSLNVDGGMLLYPGFQHGG